MELLRGRAVESRGWIMQKGRVPLPARRTLSIDFEAEILEDAGNRGWNSGMALNGVLNEKERDEASRRLEEIDDEQFKTIFGLLYKVNKKVDLFKKYDVQELFECRILSVDENFRGKGLANVLMLDSLEVARKAGFKVFKADATGMFSQKVCLKNGFQVEAEILYKDLPENIRPAPPHEALKLMVKLLD